MTFPLISALHRARTQDAAPLNLEEPLRKLRHVSSKCLHLPYDLLNNLAGKPLRRARVNVEPSGGEQRLLEIGDRPCGSVLRRRIFATAQELPARGRDHEPTLTAPLVAGLGGL